MKPEITRLSNGLTVITDPMPGLESATLGVWVGTGSRDEVTVQMISAPSAAARGFSNASTAM